MLRAKTNSAKSPHPRKTRVRLDKPVGRAHVREEHSRKQIVDLDAGVIDSIELEDYLELQDPNVREHIRKSHLEFLSGKSRPADELLMELRGLKSKRKVSLR